MTEAASPNIYQRIQAVMRDVNYVRKEEKKVNNNYTFVSHDAVTAILHPKFVEHGIVVVPTVTNRGDNGNRTEVDLQVTFVNVDDPADLVSIDCFGYGIDPQDKGPGKAISYAYKYALLKMFALETGDDPERDSIEHKPAEKKPALKTVTAKPVEASPDDAERFVNALRVKLSTCRDMQDVDDLVSKNANPLAKLLATFPDLYAQAESAISDVRLEIRNDPVNLRNAG